MGDRARRARRRGEWWRQPLKVRVVFADPVTGEDMAFVEVPELVSPGQQIIVTYPPEGLADHVTKEPKL